MKISAVICTRDRPGLVAACLPTVLRCDYRPREVLVVDQSGDGRTRDLVARFRDDDLVYVPTDTRGLSAARNVAIGRASGEVLAYTDDDCLADRGWLGALADEFRVEAGVAAICGRALPLVEVPLVARAASVRTTEERRLFRGPCSPWRIGNGSNIAFRATALRSVGPFDERLGPGARFRGGEEADMLYRLLKQGFEVLYSPLPLVYHRQWRSAAQQLELAETYGIGIGAFCAKYARSGDLRALRTLGGWVLATFGDLAAGLRGRDGGRARSAARLLGGLARGAVWMALAAPQRA